jgi:hypothetical protein
MKIMIGFKASREFKDFLKKMAKQENRTLSNYILNALLVYTKEHHGVDWNEEQTE